ncbi:hypothetical protein TEA_003931 [Camellia sinensis var. sinensis]|uniref:Uncharacterized protein n=1 Tax=Camellia sinensis var. sinensis TaxID=542762 RepID=A0A4S4E0Z3_CAMSN|nr:hypothetical protein TEA_003931 [Camellia sinensis var. sinensis]
MGRMKTTSFFWKRWAYIDLSAGPFSWGPAVGGEGVRTELSLPNVEKTIGAVAEISEDEAEDRLQDAIQEKFAVFGDKEHQAIDILLAEIDIYELFAFKHCKGRKVKLALCEELDERMQDLKNELESFEGEEYDESHKRKAVDALKRMEKWNLFSDTYEEFQNYTVARDAFLAHLGATLWGSMRHIIAPSLADGAFHHYEKISFQLFFITQEKVKHIKQLPVDLKALMDGLSSLVLPSQKATYSPHMSTLEVPIFWFIHGDPLLVDKHYQSKALSDMVIVVQSESSSWESHLQCNGHSLLWDLRRPIKAALAAVAEHLAGLVPLHLVYSHAHETAIEDWTWSVGCNPLSVTSQWWSFSQFQSDTIARSYILTALEESIQLVNSAIHLLIMERTYFDCKWGTALCGCPETAVDLGGCNTRSVGLPGSRLPTIGIVVGFGCGKLVGLLSEPSQDHHQEPQWVAGEREMGSLIFIPALLLSMSFTVFSCLPSDRAALMALRAVILGETETHILIISLPFPFHQDEHKKVIIVAPQCSSFVVTAAATPMCSKPFCTFLNRLMVSLNMGSCYELWFTEYVKETMVHLHPIHCTSERKVEVDFDMTTIPAFLVVLFVLWILSPVHACGFALAQPNPCLWPHSNLAWPITEARAQLSPQSKFIARLGPTFETTC